MDVVKLPKKVRMVCYEIMDGKEEALDTLESFADKYPHQIAAVKAEVAYFNLDYEKALALDLTIWIRRAGLFVTLKRHWRPAPTTRTPCG